MRVCDHVMCDGFPCEGIDQTGYRIPGIDLEPDTVRILLISEAAASDSVDDYYAAADPVIGAIADPQARVPLFEETTVLAFRDAGADVASIRDILDLGVYLTTAIKCSKVGYGIKAGPIHACAELLEEEMTLFPNLRAILLMGDVAIKTLNRIARMAGESRVIPAGSTYRIRGPEYMFRGVRAFPSYLQAGPSFFIEKSKRRMIAEDIAEALRVAGAGETA